MSGGMFQPARSPKITERMLRIMFLDDPPLAGAAVAATERDSWLSIGSLKGRRR